MLWWEEGGEQETSQIASARWDGATWVRSARTLWGQLWGVDPTGAHAPFPGAGKTQVFLPATVSQRNIPEPTRDARNSWGYAEPISQLPDGSLIAVTPSPAGVLVKRFVDRRWVTEAMSNEIPVPRTGLNEVRLFQGEPALLSVSGALWLRQPKAWSPIPLTRERGCARVQPPWGWSGAG